MRATPTSPTGTAGDLSDKPETTRLRPPLSEDHSEEELEIALESTTAAAAARPPSPVVVCQRLKTTEMSIAADTVHQSPDDGPALLAQLIS